MTVEVPEHFNFNIISLFCMPLVFNTPCTHPKKSKTDPRRAKRAMPLDGEHRPHCPIASAGYDANAV